MKSGLKLRELRKDKGLTQKQLAELINKSANGRSQLGTRFVGTKRKRHSFFVQNF